VMIMDSKDETTQKKRYEKPVVSQFPLRPEEAVLGFCKSSASAGPAGGTCQNVTMCRVPGS
jgi:hypothetical protein